MQCSAVQCNIVQCSTVQYSAVQCSVAQCSEVQCSAVFTPDWAVLPVDPAATGPLQAMSPTLNCNRTENIGEKRASLLRDLMGFFGTY